MATDLQPEAPGGTLTARRTHPDQPQPYVIPGGGAIASLLIGWWLYWHANLQPGGRAEAETVDA